MRMLEEFVDLSEGDVVLQNGANSAVGQVRYNQPQILSSNSAGLQFDISQHN